MSWRNPTPFHLMEKLQILKSLKTIYFDTDTTEESLVVSLGVDPQISVKREDVKDLKAKSFFGDKRIVNKKFEIIVKNNRSKSIDLKLQDRIPLTANSEIKVDDEEPGDATMDKETQILTWNIALASGAQVKKTFSYEVKYPKDKRINLDWIGFKKYKYGF